MAVAGSTTSKSGAAMCQVPVFYATTNGHTRRLAERVAEQIRKHGLGSEAVSLISEEVSQVPWERVCGAVVAASVHFGKHQPEAGNGVACASHRVDSQSRGLALAVRRQTRADI
jgi:menaquinone-dependent protoporphyrinogen IX oxidase